jgi:hypothetical protein
MPYAFHPAPPTLYPSADTLFPASSETLTWLPAPNVEAAPPRDKHVQRARDRIAAFLQARMSAKVAHAIEHAGGQRVAAVAALAELVAEGVLRVERRQQPDTVRVKRNGKRVARTPRAGTPWLVLVRP